MQHFLLFFCYFFVTYPKFLLLYQNQKNKKEYEHVLKEQNFNALFFFVYTCIYLILRNFGADLGRWFQFPQLTYVKNIYKMFDIVTWLWYTLYIDKGGKQNARRKEKA